MAGTQYPNWQKQGGGTNLLGTDNVWTGTNEFTGGLSTTTTAVNPDDVPNLSQVQDLVSGALKPVNPVVAFVNTNLVLTGIQTVSNSNSASVVLVAGDKVCVSNQTIPLQNGRYIVSAGAWTLDTDCQIGSNQTNTFFSETSTGNQFQCTSDPGIMGTDALTYVLFATNVLVSVGTFDFQAPAANALTAVNNVLFAQSASGTVPGDINLTTQVMGDGVKKFQQQVQILASSDFLSLGATNPTTITSAVTTATRTFTLPNADSNPVIPTTATSNQFLTNITAGGVQTKAQPSFSNISGVATSAQLPTPTTSAIGGVQAVNTVSNQWINSISTAGVPSLSQPAFSNISGTASLTTQVTGILPIANGGTGVSTASGMGKLLIGTTLGGYAVANLTQGTGITITNGDGSITIASDATALVTGAIGSANQVLVNGTSGSTQVGNVTFTLPQSIGIASSVIFAALNLSGLTASQAVVTDGSKNLASLAYSAIGGTSNLISRDANGVTYSNNFVSGSTSTVSAATTTNLAASSTRRQILTGSTTQIFKLPNATLLNLGTIFEFNNASTGILSINDNGNNLITTVLPGGSKQLNVTDISSAAGVWDWRSFAPSTTQWGTAGLSLNGTLTATGAGQLGTLGIGSAVETSAILSISSTTLGFLKPRMSTTQRLAIVSPATGLEVFDTTLLDNMFYNGSTWVGASTSGVTSLTGTANRVTVSGSTGAITLSGPQDIATTSNVQFGTVQIGTTAIAANTALQVTGGFSRIGQYNTTSDPANNSTGAMSVSWNRSGGGAEVNLINVYNGSPATGFDFWTYQTSAYRKAISITAPTALSGGVSLINTNTSRVGVTMNSDASYDWNVNTTGPATIAASSLYLNTSSGTGIGPIGPDTGFQLLLGSGTTTPKSPLGIFDGATDYTYYAATQIVRKFNQADNKFHLSLVQSGTNLVGIGFLNNTTTLGIFTSSSTATGTNGVFLNSIGNFGIADTTATNKLSVAGNSSIGFVAGTSAPSNGLIVSGQTVIGSSSTTANVQLEIVASNYALKIGGGVIYKQTTTKTSAYTVTVNDDEVPCNSSGGAFTVSLPTPVPNAGWRCKIFDKGGAASTNTITISANGASLNGSATQPISTNYGAMTISTDSTNFFIT